jgi:hypothetical protein
MNLKAASSSQDSTTEFEPLYPAGFHDISIDNLENIFVIPFNNNTRRSYITNRFRDYIEKFSELGLLLIGAIEPFRDRRNGASI